MNPTFRWWLINGLVLYAAIAAAGGSILGMIVTIILIGIFLGIGICAILGKEEFKKMPPFKMPVPMWLDITWDVVYVTVLILGGMPIWAALYAVAIMMVHSSVRFQR